MAGKIAAIAKQLGKDTLRKAFPNIYKLSKPYRQILAAKKIIDPKSDTLTGAVEALNTSVIETNTIATAQLEAIQAQNDLLEKLVKNGINGNGSDSILDNIVDKVKSWIGVGGTVGATVGGGMLTKKMVGRVRGSARGNGVAGGLVNKGSTLGRVAGKLMRGAPLLSGALEGISEYNESGNIAKASSVGVGTAAGGYGGALAGAAIGSVLIPIPILGTLLGGLVGGALGGWAGSKLGGMGYDMVANPVHSQMEKGLQAAAIVYKSSDTLTFKALDIIINADDIKGLLSNFGGNAATRIPTFRRGIGGKDQDFRRQAAADNAVRESAQGGKLEGHNEHGHKPHSHSGDNGKGEILPNKEGSFDPGFGGKIGQGLGASRPGHLHQGQDIMMKHGSDITASMDGVVVKSERQGGSLNERYGGTSGGIVTVKYANGVTAKYMHTSDPYDPNGPIVKAGQKVKAGDIIGKSGTAANVPHVHYELYDKDGKRMDPAAYHGWKEGGRIESPAEKKAREQAEQKEAKPEASDKPAPTNSTGKVNLDAIPKAVRDKYGILAAGHSDADIKKEAVERLRKDNPNLKIGDDGSVSGSKADIDTALEGTKKGLKENGLNIDADKLYKPLSAMDGPLGSGEQATGEGWDTRRYRNMNNRSRNIEDRRNVKDEEYVPGFAQEEKGWLDRFLDKQNAIPKPERFRPDLSPSPLSKALGAADLASSDPLTPEGEKMAWQATPMPIGDFKTPGDAPPGQLQRIKAERDKLKKELTRVKKAANNDKDYPKTDDGGEEAPPPRDETRSDRAVWNINGQLHKDDHPQ